MQDDLDMVKADCIDLRRQIVLLKEALEKEKNFKEIKPAPNVQKLQEDLKDARRDLRVS